MNKKFDYFENNVEADKEVVTMTSLELAELIEERIKEEPKSKRGISYLNKLIEKFNEQFGITYKAFKIS